MMKTLRIGTLAALVLASASCKDFLDVNDNPNAPQVVSANLYLAPMLHWMTTSPQYDGRFVGRYAQEWTLAHGVTVLLVNRTGDEDDVVFPGGAAAFGPRGEELAVSGEGMVDVEVAA